MNFATNDKWHLRQNKAVYTEGSVACCWAGAVRILYTQHPALAVLLLIVSIAQIVLSCQFGSFSQSVSDGPTDRRTNQPTDRVAYRVACTRLKSVMRATRSFPKPSCFEAEMVKLNLTCPFSYSNELCCHKITQHLLLLPISPPPHKAHTAKSFVITK